jgi:hypothetical protein
MHDSYTQMYALWLFLRFTLFHSIPLPAFVAFARWHSTQNAPTKASRFSSALCGFGKFDIPANSAGTPFSFPVSVADFEGYEPDVSDFVVYTGQYTLSLTTDAVTAPIQRWTLNVTGTYTWTWDFSQ